MLWQKQLGDFLLAHSSGHSLPCQEECSRFGSIHAQSKAAGNEYTHASAHWARFLTLTQCNFGLGFPMSTNVTETVISPFPQYMLKGHPDRDHMETLFQVILDCGT